MITRHTTSLLFIFILLNSIIAFSQERNVNYDESKAGHYSLPSVLTSYGGVVINNVSDWEEFRKSEILNSFTEHIYGKVPGELDTMLINITEKIGRSHV